MDVAILQSGLRQQLVIDLKTASSQAVYDTWASNCDVLAAPDYVLAEDTSAWTGIEDLDALAKLKSAKETSFWHVMQAWEKPAGGGYMRVSTRREPTDPSSKYYEMWWLAHRPFIDMAKGLLFLPGHGRLMDFISK